MFLRGHGANSPRPTCARGGRRLPARGSRRPPAARPRRRGWSASAYGLQSRGAGAGARRVRHVGTEDPRVELLRRAGRAARCGSPSPISARRLAASGAPRTSRALSGFSTAWLVRCTRKGESRVGRAPVLALATYAGAPSLPGDEVPLVQALSERGVLARPAVWTDDSVDWNSYAACVIRATWDYHVRCDEFLGWARRVARVCQLWNPLPMLAWNSHKGYLLNLERSGVPVVPTVLVQQGTRSLLSDIANDRSWGDLIVNRRWAPTPGRLHAEADAHTRSRKRSSIASWPMATPSCSPTFRRSRTWGERSLIYVDGELTHVVRRPPWLAPAGGQERRRS